MNMIAINLKTGRPAKWPKSPWSTGTDAARFWCVWKGSWFTLGSFSDNLRHKVPQGRALLINARYDLQVVPMSEVHIAHRIG